MNKFHNDLGTILLQLSLSERFEQNANETTESKKLKSKFDETIIKEWSSIYEHKKLVNTSAEKVVEEATKLKTKDIS